MDSDHCALGCWITGKKTTLPPRIVYILEQFTYVSFTCARQIKIARHFSYFFCQENVEIFV